MQRRKAIGYYGSDLNRFIDERCTHKMTCINIDCLIIRISQKRVRFIESKHNFEAIPHSQLTALKILKYIISTSRQKEWKVGFFIVRGDYPYARTEIQEIGSNETKILNQGQLVRWLEFKIEV